MTEIGDKVLVTRVNICDKENPRYAARGDGWYYIVGEICEITTINDGRFAHTFDYEAATQTGLSVWLNEGDFIPAKVLELDIYKALTEIEDSGSI